MLTQVGAPIQVTRWFLSRASCDACQHKTDWLWLADHYAGLSETWDNGVIYCSEQTARLIQHMDQLRIKKDLVRPLPMDTPVTIDGEYHRPYIRLQVSAFPVCNCPGSYSWSELLTHALLPTTAD